MIKEERQSFVLCLVAGVLFLAILIAGYHALTHEPKATVYDAVTRADLTSLVKATTSTKR